MDFATRNYISDLAQQVINAYGIAIPITDIDRVVKDIGGTIEEKNNFDDLCDGTIIKDGEKSFRIAISPYQNDQRRSFTIAHELGHLFLHMGFRTNADLWQAQKRTVYRRFGSSEQEYQANEFAASLLMPREIYRKALMDNAVNGRVNIAKVADYFHVSQSAAINRGRFLGYLR